MLTVFLIK